jgi:hypothetical protein
MIKNKEKILVTKAVSKLQFGNGGLKFKIKGGV